MNNTVSALEARKNFGEILNRIIYRGEEILVERKGTPVAKIVPVRRPIAVSKKINIKDAAAIRKSWARYQMEISYALKKLRNKPRHTWPKMLQ